MQVVLMRLFLLGAMCSGVACSSPSRGLDSSQIFEVETKEEAVNLALAYLEQKPFSERYSARVAKIEEQEAYWQVFFLRKEPARPSYGEIRVHKKTAEA